MISSCSTLLVRNPVWNDVSQCFNLLVEQGYMKEELNQQLFNEFVLLNEYLVETNLLAEAERKEKRQWVNIFNDFEEKRSHIKRSVQLWNIVWQYLHQTVHLNEFLAW